MSMTVNRCLAILRDLDYLKTENQKEADLILLNTCHIREKAAEKVYSELGRIKALKEEKIEISK